MEVQSTTDKVTIAPEVLETVARLTALAVPGVARLTTPLGMRRLWRQDGVEIKVTGNNVHVTLHIITEGDVNMLSVGRQIQTEVARAIQGIVGMTVTSVDVHIEDVTYPVQRT
jgi:uncharacterized alkaline shock family protein YloU